MRVRHHVLAYAACAFALSACGTTQQHEISLKIDPKQQAEFLADKPLFSAIANDVPDGETERAIAAIWCELLGIEAVGLEDNFFDLGGHSLLAMRAVVAIRERLGWQVQPPRMVYETLGQLAREENLSAS